MRTRSPIWWNPWRERQGIPWLQTKSRHNFEISRSEVGHLEQLYSTARQKSSRQPGDDMPDIDIDAMIWGICMSATMNAAVHLVQDYQENPRTTKNTDFEKSHTVVRYFAKIDIESEGWDICNIYDRLEHNSRDETDSATRQSSQAVESKGTRLLWFGTSLEQNSWTSSFNRSLEAKDWVVHEISWMSWIGRNWRRTSRVRVDNFPRTHNTAVVLRNPKNDGRDQDSTWTVRRSTSIGQKMETNLCVCRILQKIILKDSW